MGLRWSGNLPAGEGEGGGVPAEVQALSNSVSRVVNASLREAGLGMGAIRDGQGWERQTVQWHTGYVRHGARNGGGQGIKHSRVVTGNMEYRQVQYTLEMVRLKTKRVDSARKYGEIGK
jgi:hypothetical protein